MNKLLALLTITVCMCACCNDEYGYKIKNGHIVYNTPERPADQVCMIGFAAEKARHEGTVESLEAYMASFGM